MDAPTDLPASDARTDFTRDIVLSEHSAGSPERTSRSSEMGFIADEVLQLKDVSIGRFKTESDMLRAHKYESGHFVPVLKFQYH